MDSRYNNVLFNLAQTYWKLGVPVPVDLAVEMTQAGMNVQELEDQYLHNTDDMESEVDTDGIEMEEELRYLQGDWVEDLKQLNIKE